MRAKTGFSHSLCAIALCLLVASCGHSESDSTASAASNPATPDIGGSGVVNPRDAQLFRAVVAADAATVTALIDAGADTNATDVLGRTPLYSTAFYKRADIAKLLLSHGARTDIRDATGLTPLHAAVLSGGIGVATHLIDAGADINVRSESGKTPLHLAAAIGELELARLLLIDGADRTIKDSHGETAATLAEKNRHMQTLALLKKQEQRGR